MKAKFIGHQMNLDQYQVVILTLKRESLYLEIINI